MALTNWHSTIASSANASCSCMCEASRSKQLAGHVSCGRQAPCQEQHKGPTEVNHFQEGARRQKKGAGTLNCRRKKGVGIQIAAWKECQVKWGALSAPQSCKQASEQASRASSAGKALGASVQKAYVGCKNTAHSRGPRVAGAGVKPVNEIHLKAGIASMAAQRRQGTSVPSLCITTPSGAANWYNSRSTRNSAAGRLAHCAAASQPLQRYNRGL